MVLGACGLAAAPKSGPRRGKCRPADPSKMQGGCGVRSPPPWPSTCGGRPCTPRSLAQGLYLWRCAEQLEWHPGAQGSRSRIWPRPPQTGWRPWRDCMCRQRGPPGPPCACPCTQPGRPTWRLAGLQQGLAINGVETQLLTLVGAHKTLVCGDGGWIWGQSWCTSSLTLHCSP